MLLSIDIAKENSIPATVFHRRVFTLFPSHRGAERYEFLNILLLMYKTLSESRHREKPPGGFSIVYGGCSRGARVALTFVAAV
jgi:hypothetical protein